MKAIFRKKTFYKYFSSYILLTVILLTFIVLAVNIGITNNIERELINEKVKLLDFFNDKVEVAILKPINHTAIAYVVDAAVNQDSDISILMKRGYSANLYNVWTLYKKLAGEKVQNPLISSIDIYFSEKEFIVSSDGFFKNMDSYTRKDLISIFNNFDIKEVDGQWFSATTYTVNNIPREILSFVRVFPYTRSDNDKKGFVSINVYKDMLTDMTEKMNFSSNESLLILNENNNVLLSFNKAINEDYCNAVINDIAKYDASADGRELEIINKISPSKNRLLYSLSEVNGWKYLLISPWKEIIRISLEMKKSIVIVLVAILFIGILISWLLSKNIYMPIQKLLSNLNPGFRLSPQDEFLYIDNQIKQLKKKAALLSEELGKNVCLDLLYGKTNREMILGDGGLFEYNKYVVILLRQNYEHMNEEEYEHKHIIVDYMAKYFTVKAFPLDKSHYVIILNGNESFEIIEEFIKNDLASKLKEINSKFTIGVGNQVDDLNRLNESYENARTALRYEFLKGYNSIVFFKDVNNLVEGPENIVSTRKIADYIKNCQRKKLGELFKNMTENFKTNNYNIDKAEYVFFELISCLNEIILNTDLHNDFLGYKDLYHMYLRKRTVYEAIDWLSDISDNIISLIDVKHNSVTNALMIKLKDYIRNNLYEDLSLSRLSQIVFLNPTYLSAQFKQTFGVGILEYINEERLKKAKNLLLEGNHSIEEISKMVGFPITSYFIKKFKSRYGYTPKSFKMKVALENLQTGQN